MFTTFSEERAVTISISAYCFINIITALVLLSDVSSFLNLLNVREYFLHAYARDTNRDKLPVSIYIFLFPVSGLECRCISLVFLFARNPW